MSTLTISTTEKQKPLFVLNGFSYTIHKSIDKKTYWKCECSRTNKCKGLVHTDLNHTRTLNDASEHNHPPSAVKSEVRLFQEKIRSRAIASKKISQQSLKYIDYNKRLKTLILSPHSTLLKQVEYVVLYL